MQNPKPSLAFSIVDTVEGISEPEWNRLFGQGLIEGYGYHKTLIESRLQGFTLKLLLAKRNNNIVAIIPFFVHDFSFDTLMQGVLQKTIFSIQKIFPRFLKTRILFVGFPTCEEFYIGIAQEENLGEIMNLALASLCKFAKAEKISLLTFHNLSQKDKPTAEHLKKQGFAKMESFPNTAIEIKNASVREYISGLGKSTRKSLKKKLKQSSLRVELKTEIIDKIDNLEGQIYELYMNNFIDSDVYFEILNKDFFQNICRNMPGVAKFFITWDKDKAVAFNLIFIKGKTAIDKFIGFDREFSSKYNLYYTTLIHNIDYCIKNGLQSYHMGSTDYEPKLRLGAKIIPLYDYAKFLNPALNLFSGIIAWLIEPKKFDPVLKKLKY